MTRRVTIKDGSPFHQLSTGLHTRVPAVFVDEDGDRHYVVVDGLAVTGQPDELRVRGHIDTTNASGIAPIQISVEGIYQYLDNTGYLDIDV